MRSLCILILILNICSASAKCSFDTIKNSLKKQENVAISKAGGINDFDQRIDHLLEIYFNSNQNFIFPLVALHGAIWARDFLYKSDIKIFLLDHNISGIFLYKSLNKLKRLSTGLKSINRDIFIDVVSKYYTVKKWSHCPSELQRLNISNPLIRAVKISQVEKVLSNKRKFEIFKDVLLYEQKINVEPKIIALEKSLKLKKWQRRLFLRPNVQFDYFPRFKKLKFENFFNTQERIENALEAGKIALEVGEDKVIDSI